MFNRRKKEIQRRITLAREAIMNGLSNTQIVLFATHHIEEVESDYWVKHCGTQQPTVKQVLGILECKKHWGGDDESDLTCFDFTLPEDATNYVIAVRFKESGEIDWITMES